MELNIPNEILVKILGYLSHRDLCKVSLVSHRMYTLVSTPTLWTKVLLSGELLASGRLSELTSYERYSLVEKIDLYQLKVSEYKLINIIEQMEDLIGLKKIVLYDHVLTNIPAELLARTFSRLQEVVIGGTYLKEEQLRTILEASLTSATIRTLDLSNLSKVSEDMWENTGYLPPGLRSDSVNQELSKVPRELLTKSLLRLKKLSLKCNKLGLLQWNDIIENIPASSLEELDLSFNSEIIDIPSITLGRAVGSLRKVNLAYLTLTDEQLLSIFNHIRASHTLEELNISNIKLQDMPNDLISMLCSLKIVNLEGTNLSNLQVTALLNAVAYDTNPTCPNKMRSLNLSRNSLQSTPSQLLADAFTRLTILNISDTYLRSEQSTAIFSALPNSRMKYLDISGARLESVPSYVLATGVCSLREVDLSSTMTTTQQVIAILTRSKDSKTLKKVVGIVMRNIPEHLEQYAAYLSMVTPFGNVNLRERHEKFKAGLKPQASGFRFKTLAPKRPSQSGVSGLVPSPPPPPPAFGTIPPPPPPPLPPSF